MMQMEDSARISIKAWSSGVVPRKSMIWAFFMDSREATLSPVMLRRTLASPMMEYIPVAMIQAEAAQSESLMSHEMSKIADRKTK